MTSLNNEDVCRKSSVYNQTGQSYFQQLTAYNHMSAHLRRLLLAPSVVDSRNKRYARERDKRLGWTSCRSNSLEKILQARRNLIEGLAYDTKHHPIDVLRMNFKCNSGCRSKDNRASARACCVCCGQGRRDQNVPNKFGHRSLEHSPSPASQTPRSNTEPCYSYERQYESQADSDSEFGSQIATESLDALENKHYGRLNQLAEEAKYVKFIYNITQEIMINGLYTDQEIQAIFNKHLHINSEILDRDKMQSEIYKLRMSLNMTEFCEEEGEDIDRFVASGKFATFSPNKPPTPPKVLDRNKLADKIREAREEPTRFDETRRHSRNSHAGKNTVVLADANPELLITERDVLVTLMDMKLDPQQVQTIRKSLRNKSRDTAPSKTVQVDVETCYPGKTEDRANSPIEWRLERRSMQFFDPSEGRLGDNRRDVASGSLDSRDRTSMRKLQHCQCQCRQNTHYKRPVDYSETREIKAPKVERESQREQDRSEIALIARSRTRAKLSASKDRQNRHSERRARKNTKESNTSVSKFNDEQFDEKFEKRTRKNTKENNTSVSKFNEEHSNEKIEKRTRKNTKESSTSVSKFNEEHFDEKIEDIAKKSNAASTSKAALSANQKADEALDEKDLSQTEFSLKADYVGSSLPDISERSEGTVEITRADEIAASNSEMTRQDSERQDSADYANIQLQTTNYELESFPECSSQSDEEEVVEELTELSEAGQVVEEFLQLSEAEQVVEELMQLSEAEQLKDLDTMKESKISATKENQEVKLVDSQHREPENRENDEVIRLDDTKRASNSDSD